MNARLRKQGSLPLRAATAAALSIALLAGCGDDLGEVRTYTIPKEAAPAPPPPPAMTAATPAAGPMHWDLPAGWQQLPNTSQMRFATLGAGEGAAQMETAISRLGGAAGGIEANIDRWRGQLGLGAATPEDLQRDVQPIRSTGADGVWVDLIGPAPGGVEGEAPRMFAAIFPAPNAVWFLKAIGTRETLEPHRDGFLALCNSVHFGGGSARPAMPPTAPPTSPPPDGAASGATPTWGALPTGWNVDATPRAMSVASITVSDGGQEASLTITPLGGAQDMLANVNRWRRQVGLGPIADLAGASPAAIDIGGAPGQLVDVGGATERTIGAVAVRGGMTWFYKLTGPTDFVARQREAFESFVRSIRFEEKSDA